MNSRFKSNNFIGLLIALFLIATGFALSFINKQSESTEKPGTGGSSAIDEKRTDLIE